MPGLFCYATYRVGRLWLPSQVGAIAAGAFFGLSSMLTWRSWYHLNLAAGVLFIPLALEAAIRLRRRPGWRQALVLGLVVGGALLTDQEMAVLVIILTGAALLPWLLHRPAVAKLWPAALAAVVAVVFASPQIIAVMQQTKSGGATSPLRALATSYVVSGVQLPDMFAISPRANFLGLKGFALAYHGPLGDGIPTFGLVLTVLALLGLVLARRRRGAWLLALLWLGCAALALGSVLKIGTHTYTPVAETFDGQHVSAIMPYTWFVRFPVLSGFREASRIMMLGILPAALLAGAAVDWLRYHAAKAIVVVAVLGLLEAGWSGSGWISSMPTALPAVDRPIAASHNNSMVVDIPYGIRGGTNFSGSGFDPDAQVLATADGHPRAVGFISRVPAPTVAGLSKHAFFARLVATQEGLRSSPAELAAARLDARRMGVGWVLVWNWQSPGHAVLRYLRAVGFHFDYQTEGVRVWRPNATSKPA
jgi:4-amino-4-deoxy-L-arabinose transferase-like glycosyltransferase